VRFAELSEYKARHGHCNIAQYCKDPATPSGLGAWVHEQRRFYKSSKKPKSFTQDRIEKLEELGFKWKLRNRGGGAAAAAAAAATGTHATDAATAALPAVIPGVSPSPAEPAQAEAKKWAGVPDMMYMEP
jgi:hypothetical protein